MSKRYNNDEIIEELLNKGRKMGYLTSTEIFESFEGDALNAQLIDFLYDSCSKEGILIEDDFNIEECSNNGAYVEQDDLDLVRMYLKEIGEYPLLTAEKELEIGKSIKEGSPTQAQKARKKLVESNLRLVVSISKKYAARYKVPILDVIQDGNLGLMKAAEKFDYTKGYRFSTYATWWIKQSIMRECAESSRTIRLPVHMFEKVNSVKKAICNISKKNGINPTVEEIAQYMGWTIENVNETMSYFQDTMSIYSPIREDVDEKSFLIDFISDEKAITSDEIIRDIMVENILESASKYLKPREFEVIKLRFGFVDDKPLTLDEIAKKYGVTRERIRQLEAKALNKLKMHIQD